MNHLQMPPADIDAERSVLRSMLSRNDAIDLIDSQPSDFHDVRNETIFRAITGALNNGHPAIDAVTAASVL